MIAFPVRRARPADLDAIMELIAAAAAWLATRGLDQWQGAMERRRIQVHVDVVAGTVWVVEDAGRIVATVTVDEFADTDFWEESDRVEQALYVHRMAVARSHKGRGLGAALLNLANDLARGRHRRFLRLDAWSTNADLHAYYKGLGFEMRRNRPVPGRGSGALFERPVRVPVATPCVLLPEARFRIRAARRAPCPA